MEIVFTASTYLLLSGLAMLIAFLAADTWRKSTNGKRTTLLQATEARLESVDGPKPAPGPKPWPVIGSLHLMGGYDVPYKAFTALSKKYGEVFRLQMGSTPCIIVNGLENIREVLLTKSNFFDGRPDIRRYNQLFNMNRQHSLAFCDWSDVHRIRRKQLNNHAFPRAFSRGWNQLDSCIATELETFMSSIQSCQDGVIKIKPLVLRSCACILIDYFCSKKFDHGDQRFVKFVETFDKIFFDMNQGYAADFIPILEPFLKSHFKELSAWSDEIRHFMHSAIVQEKVDSYEQGNTTQDYLDVLVEYVKTKQEPRMELETALFSLEDILGGHAALGNFTTKAIALLVRHPEVQRKMQAEVDSVTGRTRRVRLEDRTEMSYVDAVMLETLRVTSSPVVPHVANSDSTIAGYHVNKGDMVFLNNYELNTSKDLWDDPEAFKPERFLMDGRVIKPDHFLPFGMGKRSCMGYKVTQLVSFCLLSSLVQDYDILPVQQENYHIYPGVLALPVDSFKVRLQKRSNR